jgi:hypothetical protein
MIRSKIFFDNVQSNTFAKRCESSDGCVLIQGLPFPYYIDWSMFVNIGVSSDGIIRSEVTKEGHDYQLIISNDTLSSYRHLNYEFLVSLYTLKGGSFLQHLKGCKVFAKDLFKLPELGSNPTPKSNIGCSIL